MYRVSGLIEIMRGRVQILYRLNASTSDSFSEIVLAASSPLLVMLGEHRRYARSSSADALRCCFILCGCNDLIPRSDGFVMTYLGDGKLAGS